MKTKLPINQKIVLNGLLFFLIVISLANCGKNDFQSSNKESSEIISNLRMTNSQQVLFSASHINTSTHPPAQGEFILNSDWTIAIGDLYIDTIHVPFVVEYSQSYLDSIFITSTVESDCYFYHNLFEGDSVLICLQEETGSVDGVIYRDSVDINFSIISFGDTTTTSGICVPCVVGAVSGLITVIGCAYERAKAREVCSSAMQSCMNTCLTLCHYYYSSGWCGGDCDIRCE